MSDGMDLRAAKKHNRPLSQSGQLCAGRVSRGLVQCNSIQITLDVNDYGEEYFIRSAEEWLVPKMISTFNKAFGEDVEPFGKDSIVRLQEIVKQGLDKAGYRFARFLYRCFCLFAILDFVGMVLSVLSDRSIGKKLGFSPIEHDDQKFALYVVLPALGILFLLALPTWDGYCGWYGPYSDTVVTREATQVLNHLIPQMLEMTKVDAETGAELPFWGDFTFLVTAEADSYTVGKWCCARPTPIEYPLLHIIKRSDYELLASAHGDFRSEPYLDATGSGKQGTVVPAQHPKSAV